MTPNDQDSRTFPMGETAQEKGFDHVPECYKMPSSSRPILNPKTADVPTVDMNEIDNPARRHMIMKDIAKACQSKGFFQIANHGISQDVLDDALLAAFSFFDLPYIEKMNLMCNDVHKPVRYGTSLKDGVDKVQFWRVFLKHYSNPLEEWIKLWPDNPSDYRKKMGKYSKEVQKLSITILGLITEGLGLGPEYLSKKIEKGMQVMVANCYPPCPEPESALGLPPHSDYSVITILLQNSPGLQIWDSEDQAWRNVPDTRGTLQVNVGDHLEVLSNGLYKSTMHRVTVNSDRTRISVVSLHSMGMDEKMEVAEELADEQHPKGYKGSSFRDFIKFLVGNDIITGNYQNFIDTLRIKNVDDNC